jgi:hypothetical protein
MVLLKATLKPDLPDGIIKNYFSLRVSFLSFGRTNFITGIETLQFNHTFFVSALPSNPDGLKIKIRTRSENAKTSS